MARRPSTSAPGPGPPIVRSPADVLRLAVSVATLLLVLLVEAVFGSAVLGFAHDLLRGLDALGEGFLTAVVAGVRVVSIALLAAGLVAALGTGRRRALAAAVLAAVTASALLALTEDWLDVRRPPLAGLADVAGPLTSTDFPSSTGVAIGAAIVTAAAPWLGRRYRRLGWTLVLALAAARFVTAPVSGSTLLAVVCGWAGGALAVVALGAPARRPTAAEVSAGLGSVGIDVVVLEPAAVDARGSTPYFATTMDGRHLFVKVLGRDERDADLLFRLYRFVLPRNLGDERPFSTLRRAVEHEALLALTTTELGVRTPRLAAFCDAGAEGYVLAYEAVQGRSLDRVDPAAVTDDVLHGIWGQLTILRRHRVAHRDLRLANLFLDAEGHVWIIDFGFAELAASDLLLATDLAELTASLSLHVGAGRAVRTGTSAVGPAAMRTAAARLAPAYLSGATRTALKTEPRRLDELRRELAAAVALPHVVGEP